jgi:acetyltransferase EpsM
MLYMVGTGGHSVSVQDLLSEYGPESYKIISAEEIHKLKNEMINNRDLKFFIAIGDLNFRQEITSFISAQSGKFKTITSKDAYISDRCSLGQGTVVMPGAYIRRNAMVGDHCIVNTGAIIEHECQIGDFTNISPNVTLCGKVTIEGRVDIGAGATVLPGKKIGSDIIVGAGSTVVSDLLKPGTYIGSPAIKKDQ